MGNKASAPKKGVGGEEQVQRSSDSSEEVARKMDVNIDYGGAKGWPLDATVVFYHKTNAMIVVGTAGGAICCYGDGFQYIRHWFQDHENEVTSIHSIGPDRILVGFGDNSLVVLSLPSLSVVDLVECTWISKQAGDVVTVHVDNPGEKGFIYIGTTEGLLLVLESNASTGAVRACEYSVNWSEAGLRAKMVISCLQICPKDERYMAIGFDGPSESEGAVVIFDLVKRKPHRVYETGAVTSLAWAHPGEALYAGTRTGDVMMCYLEKASCASVWNSASVERKDADTEEDVIIVRKVEWLPQQHGAMTSVGCLFVLLGAFGDDSADVLQSVLTCLMPEGGAAGDKLMEIMCIPPLQTDEDLVGFRVVPSIDKKLVKVRCDGGVTSDASSVVPALLMVTQTLDDYGNTLRQLKVMRCSESTNILDWALEIGMLPEPRCATEVLPGHGASITSIVGTMPPLPGSIASVLLSTAPLGESVMQMLRSAFISGSCKRDEDGDEEGEEGENEYEKELCEQTWSVVLSAGAPEDGALITKPLDVVLLGHADGTVIAWGVSRGNHDDVHGKGAVWLPLHTFKVGRAPITVLITDDIHLIAAADENGQVVVWVSSEKQTSKTGIDAGNGHKYPSFCSATHDQVVYYPAEEDDYLTQNQARIPVASLSTQDFKPNAVKEALCVDVGDKVTAMCLIGEATVLFVGTESGAIASFRDWETGTVQELSLPENCPLEESDLGAVVHLMYSSFWYNDTAVPCVYAFYAEGHVLVWHLFTLELIAYGIGPEELYSDCDETLQVRYAQVLDKEMCPLLRPNPHARPKRRTQEDTDICVDASARTSSLPPAPPQADSVTSPGQSTLKGLMGKLSPDSGKRLGRDDVPVDEANTLIVVCLHALITYNLNKFCISQKYAAESSPYTSPFSAVVPNAASSKFLSGEKIVAAQCTIFAEEAARAYTQPLPCISCISDDGMLMVLSLKNGALISDGEVPLLVHVERRPVNIEVGCLLPNGDGYLVNNGCMVHCTSFSSKTYVHNHPVPVRCGTRQVPSPPEWQFKTGREERITASKKAMQKRRASMITLTAAPTDLSKLFVKTRTDWEREDLFKGANDEEEERRRNATRSTGAALRSAAATKAELDEVRKAFEERGERLARIHERMVLFADSAAEFKANAAAHKEKLRLKNERWGVF